MREEITKRIAEPPAAIAALDESDQSALRDILRRAIDSQETEPVRVLEVTEDRKLVESELPAPEPGAGRGRRRDRLLRDLRLGPPHASLAGDLAGHRDGPRVLGDGRRARRRRRGLVGGRPGLRAAGDPVRQLPFVPRRPRAPLRRGDDPRPRARRAPGRLRRADRGRRRVAVRPCPTGSRTSTGARRAARRRRPRGSPGRCRSRRSRLRAGRRADRRDDLARAAGRGLRARARRRAGREPPGEDRGARVRRACRSRASTRR